MCVVCCEFATCVKCLNMLVVHKHGRDRPLNMCLFFDVCVMAFAACTNGDKFSFVYLILLYRWCTGIDEAPALECA